MYIGDVIFESGDKETETQNLNNFCFTLKFRQENSEFGIPAITISYYKNHCPQNWVPALPKGVGQA